MLGQTAKKSVGYRMNALVFWMPNAALGSVWDWRLGEKYIFSAKLPQH